MRPHPLALALAFLASTAFAQTTPPRNCQDLRDHFVNRWIKRNFQAPASQISNPEIQRLLKAFQKLRSDAQGAALSRPCDVEKLRRLEDRYQRLRARAHKEWLKRYEKKMALSRRGLDHLYDGAGKRGPRAPAVAGNVHAPSYNNGRAKVETNKRFGYDVTVRRGSNVRAGWPGKVIGVVSLGEGDYRVRVKGRDRQNRVVIVEYGHIRPNSKLAAAFHNPHASHWVHSGDLLGVALANRVDIKMRDAKGNFVDFDRTDFRLAIAQPGRAAPGGVRRRGDRALVWLKNFLVSLGQREHLSGRLSRKVANAIIAQSQRYLSEKMTPFRKSCFIAAMAFQESALYPRAYNRGSGAAGELQLMDFTARELGLHVNKKRDDRFNLYLNLQAGIQYVQIQLNRFASYRHPHRMRLALAAYNAGYGTIRHGRIPNYPETINYVRQITGRFAYFQKLWFRSQKKTLATRRLGPKSYT